MTMQDIPIWIPVLFTLTTLVAIGWMYLASRSVRFLVIAVVWLIVQTVLGISGVYLDTEAMPPRLMLLGFLPALVFIILAFTTKAGKAFIDRINLRSLTYFHFIRLPVEIVLAALYHQGVMSVLATFEGTNFDIFSGITAAFVGYFAFTKKLHKKFLLWWNIVCLLLLLNVVITAILAIPSPIQQLAFDQPNMAVLYFPFNLLPTVVVPLVLFAHLAAFRRLRLMK